MTAQQRQRGLNFRFWRSDLAVDFGTTNTLIYMPRRGIVLQEPSVVAMRGNAVVAVGKKAERMLGRTPGGIRAVKPLQSGVIADYDLARKMLERFISRVIRRFPFFKLRLIVTVPSGTTQVERRAVLSAGKRCGIKEVYLIEEPIAAAIGTGRPVAEPRGNFIINCGGGLTEIAVISLGGIVLASSLRQGGETINAIIQRYLFRRYRMEVGLSIIEEAKRRAGYAIDPPPDLTYNFKGINLHRRGPGALEIKAEELTEAIEPVLSAIAEAARNIFEQIPPQLAADVMSDGIVLAGGAALLHNFDLYLSRKLNLPVHRAEDPYTCAVRGASEAINYMDRLVLHS
ncbi:MAG: rod shape-determining protein [Firmicutes bacterium]|jgi:rod shape-determining protein MreB|nr:rod shape-determining protein [Bacillota bacterium]